MLRYWQISSRPSTITPCPHSRRAVVASALSWGLLAAWTGSTDVPCWRPTCFLRAFLWDALRDTHSLTRSVSDLECAPCGLVAVSWLVGLTPGANSRLIYTWPPSLLSPSALTGSETALSLSLHVCVCCVLETAKVWSSFFFYCAALTSWGKLRLKCCAKVLGRC